MTAAMPELVERLVFDGTKVGWYPERIVAWERGERIAPITIDCAMTRACQASCHFCFAQMQASESEQKITKDCFLQFLDDAAEIGVKGVSFISDGESTVVPWYADAVEHAGKLGLEVGAGSNGIKLTKSVLERVLPHLSYLRFNFSAGERKRYAEIMGVQQSMYDVVVQNIRDGMEIINRDGLSCTLNMQMVLDPRDRDQIIPFAKLCCELKPVYGIIKHCSDSSDGKLGVDYSKYEALMPDLLAAEEMGKQAGVKLTAKWNKIAQAGKRNYSRCMGPPYIMQISGNGLVAPCGMLFNEQYKSMHIGNLTRQRFKDIWASDRYMEVMRYLASEHFDPRQRCGSMCLQHNTNDYLFRLSNGQAELPTVPAPAHMGFL
jgi:MoaA/NifB/PqqE/SkfB family radical SAM enzyme